MESRITLRTLEDLAECAYDELDELTEELYDSVKFHVSELLKNGIPDMCIQFTLTNDIQTKIM